MDRLIIDAMLEKGASDARELQGRAPDMAGAALYAESDKIPSFRGACAVMNMLERPVGFVCRSSAGRVVRLLQVYDSNIFTDEPEGLPAQWGFVWSVNPVDALPFIALSTSPYGVGECCSVDGVVYRSVIANNVWSPLDYAQGWEVVA